jgi:hypothetical protein
MTAVTTRSLAHTMIGGSRKVDVRQQAREAGLLPAGKRSSRGICHIGPRKFAEFMAQYVLPVGACVISAASFACCASNVVMWLRNLLTNCIMPTQPADILHHA